jgi:hypothetical protein
MKKDVGHPSSRLPVVFLQPVAITESAPTLRNGQGKKLRGNCCICPLFEPCRASDLPVPFFCWRIRARINTGSVPGSCILRRHDVRHNQNDFRECGHRDCRRCGHVSLRSLCTLQAVLHVQLQWRRQQIHEVCPQQHSAIGPFDRHHQLQRDPVDTHPHDKVHRRAPHDLHSLRMGAPGCFTLKMSHQRGVQQSYADQLHRGGDRRDEVQV